MMRVSIGVMARAPIPGRCKTRLAKAIGAEPAARLYAAMLADRIAAVDALPATRRILVAAPEDDGVAELRRLLPRGWELLPQRGADLGARLRSAFEDLVGDGDLVCLVDSDSPAVSFSTIWASLERPRSPNTVVIGPCEDGGYYLVGMTSLHVGILADIPWSTSGVTTATRQRCSELGLQLDELALSYDVDEAEDVKRIARDLKITPDLAPRTAAALTSMMAAAFAAGEPW